MGEAPRRSPNCCRWAVRGCFGAWLAGCTGGPASELPDVAISRPGALDGSAPVADARAEDSSARVADAAGPEDSSTPDADARPEDSSAPDADAGPRDSSAPVADARAADASGIASRVCPGAPRSASADLEYSELKRSADVGPTEAEVVFCNPLLLTPSDELIFAVDLLDHLGIPRSDLSTSWVETDLGRADGPVVWDGPDLSFEEHHVLGHLTSPATTADGIELIGPGTTFLALHLDGIGSQDPVELRWDGDALR